jgi:rare lipoprotein A
MYRVILTALSIAVLSTLQFLGAPAAKAGGLASFYGFDFAGRLTANGERYNPMGMTAASKTLPFGTIVRVTNRNNGRSVVVRINDRGPYIGGRVIDMSQGAAGVLGMINSGVAPVDIAIIGRGSRSIMAAKSHKPKAVQVAARVKKHGKVGVKIARAKVKKSKAQLAFLKKQKAKKLVLAKIKLKKGKTTSIARTPLPAN